MKGSFEKKNLKVMAMTVKGFREFEPMFHQHLELIYVIEGEVNMCIDGKVRTLHCGEMSITFPYMIHSYEKAPDAEAMIIMFSPENADLFEKELVSFRPENPYIGNAKELVHLIHKLISFVNHNEKMTNAYLNVIVGEVIERLTLVKNENMDINAAQQILTFCSDHFNENINIKSVASALYLSESYVSKIFSNKLGYSFREYVNTLRISEAKKMLKNPDAKITEVMYACGFTNQSSFNRVFLKETGYTPSKYKQKRI